MDLSSPIPSLLAWYFLPPFLSSLVLKGYYVLLPATKPLIYANSTPQQKHLANQRATTHARNARILLILGYLVYSLLSTYRDQINPSESDLYTLLALPRATVQQGGAAAVRSHWKKLARVYHPDKLPAWTSPAEREYGERRFVQLRHAVEILEDEVKRWGYERFGLQVFAGEREGDEARGRRQYLLAGMLGVAGYYAVLVTSVVGLGWLSGSKGSLQFWRYFSLALLFFAEYSLLVRPLPSRTLSFLLPHRLTYQHIQFLRQFFIAVSLALVQLFPLLFPTSGAPGAPEGPETPVERHARTLAEAEALRPLLERLSSVAQEVEREIVALQAIELRALVQVPAPQSAPVPDEAVVIQSAAVNQAEKEQAEREAAEGNVQIMAEVKQRMLVSYSDLAWRATPEGAQLWSSTLGQEMERLRNRAKVK